MANKLRRYDNHTYIHAHSRAHFKCKHKTVLKKKRILIDSNRTLLHTLHTNEIWLYVQILWRDTSPGIWTNPSTHNSRQDYQSKNFITNKTSCSRGTAAVRFCVSLMRKSQPPLPLLSGALLHASSKVVFPFLFAKLKTYICFFSTLTLCHWS